MIPTEDSKAIVRILAWAVAKKWMRDPEELLDWAYKNGAGASEEGNGPILTGDAAAAQERINYQAVLVSWNDTMQGCVPKVSKLTDGRKDKIRQRVKEMGGWDQARHTLSTCFDKINASEFCNGSTGWTATFDWFFSNDKNWAKVLEGNYDNRRGKTDLEKMKDEIAKADAYYEQRYGKPAGAYGNTAGRGSYGPDEQ